MIVILNMEVLIMESELFGKLSCHPETESANQKPSLLNNSGYQKERLPNGTSLSLSFNGESYPPTVQPSYKPPPNYRSHGAILKNDAPSRIIPIAALNPYQGRWAIKARVTAKGELRRYNNARGDGKVFSFDLLDSDGGEIRVICFNAIVDRFLDAIEVGKVYVISKGSLKPAQKNFNHLTNDWEIFLETSSIVELCPEEDDTIPPQQFNFKAISDIMNAENNSIVDLIGIVTSINPSVTILRKNGMETQRRIVTLKDSSGMSVELTLWGDFCNSEGRQLQELFDSGAFSSLAVKAGKVSDFSGKSVGTISASQLFINPEIPEALSLREWFDKGGKDISSNSISRETMAVIRQNVVRKNVSQIKDEGLGRGDKPDWVTLKATVSFIKTENFCYTACPLIIGDRQCSKKVTKLTNGNWCCERCDREFEECEYRYLLQAQVQDHSGVTWVTAFQESGEEMLDCSAKELFMLKQHDDPKFAEIVRSCLFVQFLFRIKIKEEHFGEEQKVKITVVNAEKVNPLTESRYLLEEISKFDHIAF
ncbi:replication protein A 70 kDa DNA-binding subunit A-like isoform X2 [Phalaenopsis equestris]|nr:replication protein A 70 kDa DNA-binding subunit A-like isoform X2 [Phalaenopsis equestris]